ncbi:MFS transporter [Arenimonas sp.]|nr:MFS transporter [Candidatus Parcubacteria bacterium]
MEKYLSIRVQTTLYISIFFISLHHVFIYLINSSTLKYVFGLKTSEVLSIYGIASLFGICTYMVVLKRGITDNIKKHLYLATSIEIVCLTLMYYFSVYQNVYIFIGLFLVHQLITPYIMFNLDSLFEAYTNIKDRGRCRGIYLTVWNIPFIIIPLIMSALSVNKLPIVYLISTALLFPFLYLVFRFIKNPSPLDIDNIKSKHETVYNMLKAFFQDVLDRKAFITQSLLHLYYGSLAILLPIYLHSVFLFDWNKIGLILAAMTAPFVLIQIPFGNMEDRNHNEKGLFKIGVFITFVFSALVLFVNPSWAENTSFLLLSLFLFLSHIGCSLIEISTESIFYKHVTERDHTALLMFRMARILPYSLGIIALLFVR